MAFERKRFETRAEFTCIRETGRIAAALFHAIRSERQTTALLREIHNTIEHDATRSRAIYRVLKKQRRVLHQLSEYLLPVPKGVEKPAS